MKLYYAEVGWYNDFDGTENKDKMFIFGETIVEASQAMNEAYQDITYFSLSEINADCSPNIFYLPDDCSYIERLKDVNNY